MVLSQSKGSSKTPSSSPLPLSLSLAACRRPASPVAAISRLAEEITRRYRPAAVRMHRRGEYGSSACVTTNRGGNDCLLVVVPQPAEDALKTLLALGGVGDEALKGHLLELLVDRLPEL